jgi:hypothetical protein
MVQRRYNSDSKYENVTDKISASKKRTGNWKLWGLEMESYVSRKMRLKGTEGEPRHSKDRAEVEEEKKEEETHIYIYTLYIW